MQGTTDAQNSVTGGGRVGVFLVHRHSQNLPSPAGLCKISFSCLLPLHLLKWFGGDENYLPHHGFYEYVGTRSTLHLPFPSWQDMCPRVEFYVKCQDKHLHRNLPNFLKNCVI